MLTGNDLITPPTQRPIVLHGNNFDSNRGCQALRITTQMLLDRYLPDYPRWHANIFQNDDRQFHSVVPDPKSTRLIWETRRQGTLGFYAWGAKLVTAAFWRQFPPMRINGQLDQAAALLAVGGDNLSFDYGFLASQLFFSPIASAVRQKIPAVIWGASIGPFTSRPYWEKRFADVLRRVDLITIREPLTEAYLRELGIRDNLARVADSAFLLPAHPTQLPVELESALNAGAVGVNLAPLMTRYNRLSSGQWFQLALDMVREIHRFVRDPLILIPHVMMPRHIFPDNDDFCFLRDLQAALPPATRQHVFLYDARNDTCQQIKGVIARLKAFIGARTHATIASLSSNVPTFCVGYSVKSRGLNREIFGHERWVEQVSRLSATELAERTQELLSESENIRRHLQAFMPEYTQRAWRGGELLRDLLNK